MRVAIDVCKYVYAYEWFCVLRTACLCGRFCFSSAKRQNQHFLLVEEMPKHSITGTFCRSANICRGFVIS